MSDGDYNFTRAEVLDARVKELELQIASERDRRLGATRAHQELEEKYRMVARESNRLFLMGERLRDLLWPADADPDQHEWKSGELDEAARILRDEGFGPKE